MCMPILCFLTSWPGPHVELIDEVMFWQCGCQVMCLLIGTSLKLAVPNYGPAFG